MVLKTFVKDFTIATKKRLEFITITSRIKDIVAAAGVMTGLVVIQTLHTTARLWLNEDEKNLIGADDWEGEQPDIHRVLDRFASPEEEYGHNDIKDARNPQGKRDTHLCKPDAKGICHECRNGHAHAQALMLPASMSLIVEEGELVLGDWQEIMLVELDHDRDRTVKVLVQGEAKEF